MYLKELPLTTVNKTVLKVKMFVRHSLEGVEEELNEWLRQQGITIRYVTQSQCEKQGKFVFVISVFYELL